jgi:hypothetical protein
MMRPMRSNGRVAPGATWLAAALLLAAAPAAAQGVPEALRGTWVQGECAAPAALLHVTARAVARLPAEGDARLVRFRDLRGHAGWTLGAGGGAEAPRVMLRAAGDALETAEPDAKTRDDRLPGAAPVTTWRRCAEPPAGLALLHGEGLAFLGTLERLEAACQGGTAAACIATLVAEGDVSGDGMLGVAELARLLRGAAWALAAQDGAAPVGLAAATALGSLPALVAARAAVESLDYDGDGRLSAEEIGRDRTGFPRGTGDASGRPTALEGLADAAGVLRGLLERLASE